MAPWSTGPQVLSHSRSDVAALWAAICKRLLAPPNIDPATPADLLPARSPTSEQQHSSLGVSVTTDTADRPASAIPGSGNDQLAFKPNGADRQQLSRESPE